MRKISKKILFGFLLMSGILYCILLANTYSKLKVIPDDKIDGYGKKEIVFEREFKHIKLDGNFYNIKIEKNDTSKVVFNGNLFLMKNFIDIRLTEDTLKIIVHEAMEKNGHEVLLTDYGNLYSSIRICTNVLQSLESKNQKFKMPDDFYELIELKYINKPFPVYHGNTMINLLGFNTKMMQIDISGNHDMYLKKCFINKLSVQLENYSVIHSENVNVNILHYMLNSNTALYLDTAPARLNGKLNNGSMLAYINKQKVITEYSDDFPFNPKNLETSIWGIKHGISYLELINKLQNNDNEPNIKGIEIVGGNSIVSLSNSEIFDIKTATINFNMVKGILASIHIVKDKNEEKTFFEYFNNKYGDFTENKHSFNWNYKGMLNASVSKFGQESLIITNTKLDEYFKKYSEEILYYSIRN